MSLCERRNALQYSNLDDFVVALLEYLVHVDDLSEGDPNKANVNEGRKNMYPESQCAACISTFRTYVNGLVAAWTYSSNGPIVPSSTRWFPKYTSLLRSCWKRFKLNMVMDGSRRAVQPLLCEADVEKLHSATDWSMPSAAQHFWSVVFSFRTGLVPDTLFK